MHSTNLPKPALAMNLKSGMHLHHLPSPLPQHRWIGLRSGLFSCCTVAHLFVQARDRKMFGLLRGTLLKAKTEETQLQDKVGFCRFHASLPLCSLL